MRQGGDAPPSYLRADVTSPGPSNIFSRFTQNTLPRLGYQGDLTPSPQFKLTTHVPSLFLYHRKVSNGTVTEQWSELVSKLAAASPWPPLLVSKYQLSENFAKNELFRYGGHRSIPQQGNRKASPLRVSMWQQDFRHRHTRCTLCLRLQHAQDALASPNFCKHCACLSLRSLQHRLPCQTSVLVKKKILGVTPGSSEMCKVNVKLQPAQAGEITLTKPTY